MIDTNDCEKEMTCQAVTTRLEDDVFEIGGGGGPPERCQQGPVNSKTNRTWIDSWHGLRDEATQSTSLLVENYRQII